MQSFTTKAEDARALLSAPPFPSPLGSARSSTRPHPCHHDGGDGCRRPAVCVRPRVGVRVLSSQWLARPWAQAGSRGHLDAWAQAQAHASERERGSERARARLQPCGGEHVPRCLATHQRSPRGARRCPHAPGPTSGRNETAPGACPRRHRLNRRCRPPCLRSAARPRPRRQPPRRRRSASASQHGPASALVMGVGREEGSGQHHSTHGRARGAHYGARRAPRARL